MLLARCPQHPVKRRLRRHVNTLISQRWNDLAGRHTLEALTVADIQNLLPFLFSQLVRGRRTRGFFTAIAPDTGTLLNPALYCTYRQVKNRAGPYLASTAGYGLIYQRNSFSAIWQRNQTSSCAGQIAAAFFDRTRSAAASARALSLRCKAFSSFWMRLLSSHLDGAAGLRVGAS